jgi:hypothetical protein
MIPDICRDSLLVLIVVKNSLANLVEIKILNMEQCGLLMKNRIRKLKKTIIFLRVGEGEESLINGSIV